MEGDEGLTPVDPRYASVVRIQSVILSLILLALAAVLESIPELPTGLFLLPALALAIWLVIFAPSRRVARWGYDLGEDRLRIASGFLFRSDTVVPLGRIQHIDLRQGPLMRRFDLATLVVHTAGNHNASVALPGLKQADAVAMREAIRDYIKEAQR
jgi:membrane protein YdbS with pleckstrin-like domain